MSNEIRVNGIYDNPEYPKQLKKVCHEATSAKSLMQGILALHGVHTENIGKAVKFDPNTGVATEVELVPYPSSKITEFFLDNRYTVTQIGYDGWFFRGKKMKLHEDVAAALHAAWLRCTKNVIYTVPADNEGVDDFHFTAVDRIETRSGSHNESDWTEKVQGFELKIMRNAPVHILNVLEVEKAD